MSLPKRNFGCLSSTAWLQKCMRPEASNVTLMSQISASSKTTRASEQRSLVPQKNYSIESWHPHHLWEHVGQLGGCSYLNPQVSGAGCIFVKHDHLESFLGRLQHLQWTLERHIYHDESITYISKPDKTAFCVLVNGFSHNLSCVIYSENKESHKYRLQKKRLKSFYASIIFSKV